jgi:acyl-CoA synthetase (AMP-forming)/AMP-acid ligase II
MTGRVFSGLERVLSAGAPSNPDVLAAMTKALPPESEIFTPYGATEALPVSNLGSREILEETGEKTRHGAGVCVGRAVRGVTVHIIPITDAAVADWSDVSTLPAGQVGEITVCGSVVSRQYVNSDEANQLAKIPCRTTSMVYHRMGDRGYLDDKGRLWMCGRKSHRVITPRRVYFTIPVEGVFNAHPAVSRTALVGIPAREETIPSLCVELAEGRRRGSRKAITEELLALGALYDHTREIRQIFYHASFPVDARHNSKIRREELAAWAGRRIRPRRIKTEEKQR